LWFLIVSKKFHIKNFDWNFFYLRWIRLKSLFHLWSNRPKIEGHTIIDLTAFDAMASLNLTGWNVQHEFAKGRLRFLPVPRIQIIISENLFFTRFKKVSKNKVFSHQFYIWKTRGHFTASLLDFSFQGILKKIRSQAQCFRIDSK
jgi:hypothetical protein